MRAVDHHRAVAEREAGVDLLRPRGSGRGARRPGPARRAPPRAPPRRGRAPDGAVGARARQQQDRQVEPLGGEDDRQRRLERVGGDRGDRCPRAAVVPVATSAAEPLDDLGEGVIVADVAREDDVRHADRARVAPRSAEAPRPAPAGAAEHHGARMPRPCTATSCEVIPPLAITRPTGVSARCTIPLMARETSRAMARLVGPRVERAARVEEHVVLGERGPTPPRAALAGVERARRRAPARAALHAPRGRELAASSARRASRRRPGRGRPRPSGESAPSAGRSARSRPARGRTTARCGRRAATRHLPRGRAHASSPRSPRALTTTHCAVAQRRVSATRAAPLLMSSSEMLIAAARRSSRRRTRAGWRTVAEGGVPRELRLPHRRPSPGGVDVAAREAPGLEEGGDEQDAVVAAPVTARRARSIACTSARTWPRSVESLRLTISTSGSCLEQARARRRR